jgi:hypothetical protein
VRHDSEGLPVEVAAVWLLLAVAALEIFVTYARLPHHVLYNVSHDGVAGGAGRVLVFANFPVALAAIALTAVSWSARLGPRLAIVATVAVVLCTAVFWPGVVRQWNLDARPVNAIAAVGVGAALIVTIARAGQLGVMPLRGRSRGDVLRAVLAALAVFIGLPWIAADNGQFLDRVPGLGFVFLSGQLRSQPGNSELHPAVHHGHHHGMDGILLVLTALLLSRTLTSVRSRRIAVALAAYLALMLSYGIGEIANDSWLEQVVKRGWTTWQIPDVSVPAVTTSWAVVVVAAISVWALWFRPLAAGGRG